jgi:hypothetical protein
MTISTPGFRVRPASIDDIPLVLDNLLDNSLEDLLRCQLNPVLSLAMDVSNSEAYLALTEDNKPAALFGFESDCFWMHMCRGMEEHPVAFMKFAKRWFKGNNTRPFLWNHTGIEYTQAIKMAKFFGFKILRVFPSALTNSYQVEMVLL